MATITHLKHLFRQGSIVQKLLYINSGVFIVSLLFGVFQELFKSDVNSIMYWFSLSNDYIIAFKKPWSIISYGFLHANFPHIFFNLITLFYIGNLFLDYFTQKQLLTFYLLGTFFGGVLFIISQQYFPLFKGQQTYLVGASAGISAIFIGIATYIPNYAFKIRFIGFVKLWYLAAIWIFLDILGLSGSNGGGHFSHLGGSLFGFLYVTLSTSKNTSFLKMMLSSFKKSRKPLKTVYKSPNKKQSAEKNSSFNQEHVNAILDKISKSGYDTLTKEEKEFLFKQGNRK